MKPTTNQPLISIIMPVYNSISFVSDAIESVMLQSYKNWELIMIDDGSTDGSSYICQEYVKKDVRIRYYQQENQGISIARNYAMELANGDYIGFCDHDDTFNCDYMLHAINAILETNADVVKSSYEEQIIYNHKIKCTTKHLFENHTYSYKDILNTYKNFSQEIASVWNCLYRKNLVKTIKFDESMKFGGEDICFNLETVLPNIRYVSISYIGYTHYKRINQSASSKFDANRLESLGICLEKERRKIEFLIERDSANRLLTNAQANYIFAYMSILKSGKTILTFKEVVNFLKELRRTNSFYDMPNIVKCISLIDIKQKYIYTYLLFKYRCFWLMTLLVFLRRRI